MQTCSVKVSLRVAWWLWPCLFFLGCYYELTLSEPNWARVNRILDRAITFS